MSDIRKKSVHNGLGNFGLHPHDPFGLWRWQFQHPHKSVFLFLTRNPQSYWIKASIIDNYRWGWQPSSNPILVRPDLKKKIRVDSDKKNNPTPFKKSGSDRSHKIIRIRLRLSVKTINILLNFLCYTHLLNNKGSLFLRVRRDKIKPNNMLFVN